MSERVRVRLLGPVAVSVGGHDVAVGGPKLKAIVAMLALASGRIVSTSELLDGAWGEDLPDGARNALQYHMSVLRKGLAAAGAAEALATRGPGYALAAQSDVARFLQLAAAGRTALQEGRAAEAADALTDALNEWSGQALADVREAPFATMRAVSLERQRLACLESWAGSEVAAGHLDSLVGPLHELVAENPTSELLWEHLIVALYRSGRQDAALAAYQSARDALDRELGVDPSARLQTVHQAVLEHDPRLAPLPMLRSVVPHTLARTTLAGAPTQESVGSLLGPGGRRVELGRAPITIGRSRESDLVIDDDRASRRHAEVRATADGFELADLGSTNGTGLNGRAVTAAVQLCDGDRVEIGHAVVHVRLPSPLGER